MGAPAASYANNDEKTWVLIAHYGGAVGAFIGAGCGGWIAPLVAFAGKGNESPTVRAHAVAALNFQIIVAIVAAIGWAFACILIGFVAVGIAVVAGVLFGVLAGAKANEGQQYKYPVTVNLVK